MTKPEERMDITSISVENKTNYLTVIHNHTTVTKNSRLLPLPDTNWNGQQPVHQDLKDVLQLMVPHMLMLIEVPGYKIGKPNYLSDKKALDDEKIKGYYVSGFSISDKEMLSIKGGIEASSGKRTPLNAHVFMNIENTSYEYLENLLALVEEAKEESMAYFIDGKFGDGAQPGLFDAAAESKANQN